MPRGGVSRDRLLWFGRCVAGGTASDTGLASHARRGGRDSRSATRGDGDWRVEYCRGGRGRREQQRPRVCGLPDGSRSPLGLHMPRLGQAGGRRGVVLGQELPSGRRWGIGMGMDGDADGERGGDGGEGLGEPRLSPEAETGAAPPTPPLHPGPDTAEGTPYLPPFLTSHPPPRTNFGHSPPFNSVSLNGCNGDTSVAWTTLRLDDQGRQTVTAVALVTDRDKSQHRPYHPFVPRQCRQDRPAVPCCDLFRSHLPAARRRVSTRWEGGVRPNSALHPAASRRTRRRRSGHHVLSRYPRPSPGSWSPTKKKQALTASSPIVGLARIDLAQSLAMHVTSRSRQCHFEM